MPKFKDLTEAFWHIREHPTEYLPEKSLALFQPFWYGYELRFNLAFPKEEAFDLLDGFHEFVSIKYIKSSSTRGSHGFARLYSKNEAEAYDRWFSDLNEFLDGTKLSLRESEYLKSIKKDIRKIRRETKGKSLVVTVGDFYGFLKIILRRPKTYVGDGPIFSHIASLIAGWFRVAEDFELERSEQEIVFKDFQKYVSERAFWLRPVKGSDLPPPPNWKNVLLAQYQSEEGALKAFTEYIDEYVFQGKRSVSEVEYRWGLETAPRL